jgi:hypothetical protein
VSDLTTEALLSNFRHEHLPPHLARISAKIGDVARDLAAGADKVAAGRLVEAAMELRQSLPVGPELAEGLALLADAAVGLPGDVEHLLRGLAASSAADVAPPSDPALYQRLRLLLRAKDALVRAAVSRPASDLRATQPVQVPVIRDVRREG